MDKFSMYKKYAKSYKKSREDLIVEYGACRDILSIESHRISVDWNHGNDSDVLQFVEIQFRVKDDKDEKGLLLSFRSTNLLCYVMYDMIDKAEKMKNYLKGGGFCTLHGLNEYIFGLS